MYKVRNLPLHMAILYFVPIAVRASRQIGRGVRLQAALGGDWLQLHQGREARQVHQLQPMRQGKRRTTIDK